MSSAQTPGKSVFFAGGVPLGVECGLNSFIFRSQGESGHAFFDEISWFGAPFFVVNADIGSLEFLPLVKFLVSLVPLLLASRLVANRRFVHERTEFALSHSCSCAIRAANGRFKLRWWV